MKRWAVFMGLAAVGVCFEPMYSSIKARYARHAVTNLHQQVYTAYRKSVREFTPMCYWAGQSIEHYRADANAHGFNGSSSNNLQEARWLAEEICLHGK